MNNILNWMWDLASSYLSLRSSLSNYSSSPGTLGILAGCHCACLYDLQQTTAHMHTQHSCIPVYTHIQEVLMLAWALRIRERANEHSRQLLLFQFVDATKVKDRCFWCSRYQGHSVLYATANKEINLNLRNTVTLHLLCHWVAGISSRGLVHSNLRNTYFYGRINVKVHNTKYWIVCSNTEHLSSSRWLCETDSTESWC